MPSLSSRLIKNGLFSVLMVAQLLVFARFDWSLEKMRIAFDRWLVWESPYHDPSLVGWREEILSHGVPLPPVQARLDEVRNRLRECIGFGADVSACIEERRPRLVELLREGLLRTLSVQPAPTRTVDRLRLPAEAKWIDLINDGPLTPKMSFSPRALWVAYRSSGGQLYLADLGQGVALRGFFNHFKASGTVLGLQLSQSGRLLLVQTAEGAGLYSTVSGRRMQWFAADQELFFTRSQQFLLAKTSEGFELIDLLSGSHTPVEGDPALETMNLSFDTDSNLLLFWNEAERYLGLLRLNEERQRFDSLAEIRFAPEIAGTLGSAVFDPENKRAYAFLNKDLYQVNLRGKGSYRWLATAPYIAGSFRGTLQSRRLVGAGLLQQGGAVDRVDFIDLHSGDAVSMIDAGGYLDAQIVPTPVANSVLVGRRQGLQLLSLDFDTAGVKRRLSRKLLDRQRPEAIVRRSTRKPAEPITLIAEDAAEPQATDAIYKCRTASGRIEFRQGPCAPGTTGAPLTPPASSIIKAEPLPEVVDVGDGLVGLQLALRQGLIRPASDAEMGLWKSRSRERNRIMARIKYFDRYKVLHPLKFTGGLAGADSVVFIVDDPRMTPMGDIGHSVVLYTRTGACQGRLCRL